MATKSSQVKSSLSKWLCSCISGKKEKPQRATVERNQPRQRESRPISAQPNRNNARSISSFHGVTVERLVVPPPQPREPAPESVKTLRLQTIMPKDQVKVVGLWDSLYRTNLTEKRKPCSSIYVQYASDISTVGDFRPRHAWIQLLQELYLHSLHRRHQSRYFNLMQAFRPKRLTSLSAVSVGRKILSYQMLMEENKPKSISILQWRLQWNRRGQILGWIECGVIYSSQDTDKLTRNKPELETSAIKQYNDHVPSRFAFSFRSLLGQRHNTI